jgi:hypothetical protein
MCAIATRQLGVGCLVACHVHLWAAALSAVAVLLVADIVLPLPLLLLQNTRDVIMREFRSGSSRVLITTDLLARGIDVQQVRMRAAGHSSSSSNSNSNPFRDTPALLWALCERSVPPLPVQCVGSSAMGRGSFT